MSRYIIAPKLDEDKEDIFQLIPTEGITEQIKDIELPHYLIPDITHSRQIKSEKELRNLILKFSKANIGRSKDGYMCVKSKVLDIKYDDFLVDCVNNVFKERYENVYCMLRNLGITF